MNELKILRQQLENGHSNLITDIESSLESFMKQLPENPLSLPIKTKIVIERKNVPIDHLMFDPTESTDKLFSIVKNYFVNLGDEIDFQDSKFVYYENEFSLGLSSKKENLIIKGKRFLSTGLKSGQVIYLIGNFVLKSEKPKNCITYNFDAKVKNISNYFTCNDCKLNWICPNCIECCHKGHSFILHIENHDVNWPCCYCLKNNCLIKNKLNN